MAPKLGPRTWVLAVAMAVLLAGCGTWWQQQQAWQRRQALERCLQRRSTIEQQRRGIAAAQRSLRQIAGERYQAAPAPQPIDPELASRFSQLDRQLDDERHSAAVAAWQQRELQRQQRWQQTQRERRSRAERVLTDYLNQLSRVDRSLVAGGQPQDKAIAALSRCDGSSP